MAAGHVGAESKPRGVACPHMSESGCRQYTNRPAACRRFECAWLADPAWPAHWRPDRSGLLCLREWIAGSMRAAAVYELRSRALRSSTGRAVIRALQQSCSLIAVTKADRSRFNLAPDDDLAAFLAQPRPHEKRPAA
jgi:hypothetical protein